MNDETVVCPLLLCPLLLRSGATLATEEGMKTFLLLVSCMRSESVPSQEAVSATEIESIVFGLERK